ncbi:MAG: lasso peptide biosynthesis B2 protein [Symploca sp. SIO2E9]|nr:lasso peptide biosynthesis B2 protein [Symploca sp. SIO2E9]
MMSYQLLDRKVIGYKMHPDTIWIPRFDGSCHLMHMGANTCAIDADSAALLKSILDIGLEGSVADLALRYGVDEAEIREDVQDFIRDLRKQKLIQPLGYDGSPLERALDSAARTLISGVLRLVTLGTRNLQGRGGGLLWAARWAVAQFGWARTVREWERVYPQPTVPASSNAEKLETVDWVVRQAASHSPIGVECKERGLACLALARESGIPAQLVVGISLNPLRGHVWVEAEGRVISDDPEHCRLFEPVARYG